MLEALELTQKLSLSSLMSPLQLSPHRQHSFNAHFPPLRSSLICKSQLWRNLPPLRSAFTFNYICNALALCTFKMIISTAGSRVIKRDRNEVRRKTLLDIAKGEDVHDSRNEVITRRRTVSDVDPVAAGNIKMDDIGVMKKKKNDESPKPAILLRDLPPRVQEDACKLPEEHFQTAWINIVSERDVNQITATQRQA